MELDERRLIPASAVRDICGGVSDMWIWRRLHDPDAGFPKPTVIARRRFWREAELAAWLDAQADKSREAA
jgi:predicted DNA-binding transcriptional regulator AlpA